MLKLKLHSENYAHLPAFHIVWNLGEKALIGKNDHKLLQGRAKLFWREFERNTAKTILKEAKQSKVVEQPKFWPRDVPPVK